MRSHCKIVGTSSIARLSSAARADSEAIAFSVASFICIRYVYAIASATLPTIIDVGANTGVSLLTVIAGLREDLAAAGIEFGVLVVTTAEPGALAEVPKLLSVAAPWAVAVRPAPQASLVQAEA